MRKLILIMVLLTVLSTTLFAEFKLESLEVTISDIQKDGSAKVRESIKLLMTGDYSTTLYESGFATNDLAFWATTINLKEVKLHTNPNKADITDFRLRPQPKRKCDPFQNLCHGELIIEYYAHPYFNQTTGEPIAGTGLFTLTREKPRTIRYNINPDALSFLNSEQGNIILDKKTYLTIVFPKSTVITDANPLPEEMNIPSRISRLTWNDVVLVRLSLEFESEEGLDKEVAEFFSDLTRQVLNTISGPQGLAILIITGIFISFYFYLQSVKKREG